MPVGAARAQFTRVLRSWWPRRTRPGVLAGVLVAAVLIAVETAVGYPLTPDVTPGTLGIVYLFGVVVVSAGWGLWLGMATALVSAAAFDYFHLDPDGWQFTTTHWVAIPLFLVIALLVGAVAEVARSWAIDAHQRRKQAEHAAEQARALAEEQAALRRVATLTARGAPPSEVLAAVAGEIGGVLDTRYVQLGRFEPDATVTVVASWSTHAHTDNLPPVGSRWAMPTGSFLEPIWRTGRPQRADNWTSPEDSGLPRDACVTCVVGCPILTEGRVWGVVTSLSAQRQPETAQTRISEFTELLGTAIANAESRTQLTEARTRVVAAIDDTHRRLERELHQSIQHHLVPIGTHLSAAQEAWPEASQLNAQLAEIDQDLVGLIADLQRLSWGLPPLLPEQGGLTTAIEALARECAIPVDVEIRLDKQLPHGIETAVYHVITEALANAAQHSRATTVHIELDANETNLHLTVRDNGIGGANPSLGSGLLGLRDRVEALNGRIGITSPPEHGTAVQATIPLTTDERSTPRRPTGGAGTGASDII
jgi:signal transduction histidine kinase